MPCRLTFKTDESDRSWLVDQVNQAEANGRVSDEVRELVETVADENPEANNLIRQLVECENQNVSEDIGPVAFSAILAGLIQRIVDKSK
jgi:predicted transcriptional regulator